MENGPRMERNQTLCSFVFCVVFDGVARRFGIFSCFLEFNVN